MCSLPSLVVLLGLSTFCFGSSWVGQERVNRPNGDTLDGQPTTAIDSHGQPWVIWIENLGDTTLYWSRWGNDGWEPQRGVSANAPGVHWRFRPDISNDGQNGAWVVWHNAYENNNRDIAACYWDGSTWGDEQQVNLPDSTDVDFAPKVSCGGGQVWCVWYGGLTDMSPYSVYASRWNDSTQAWGPEMRVSPADGNHHWWCEVAVDTSGSPHVVWCTYPLYTVFHSYFDGEQWATPAPVNDTSKILASSWASPRIVIDHDGVMHVSFTGANAGATHRDVFYTHNDGSGWSPCHMVTRDSLYDEWYSDIAANVPDNVWIVWDRQNEGSDQFRVYAAHYDGQEFSAEQRLDNDSAYHDDSPAVCLDSVGGPWVFWNGITYGSSSLDVFFNRFAEVGLAEARPADDVRATQLRCTSPQHGPGVSAELYVAAAVHVRFAVYDEIGRCRAVLADGFMPRGAHTVYSREVLVPGVHFVRGAEAQTQVQTVLKVVVTR